MLIFTPGSFSGVIITEGEEVFDSARGILEGA